MLPGPFDFGAGLRRTHRAQRFVGRRLIIMRPGSSSNETPKKVSRKAELAGGAWVLYGKLNSSGNFSKNEKTLGRRKCGRKEREGYAMKVAFNPVLRATTSLR